MTAATATIMSGGSTKAAFMAALLDLASRDELRFRDEGGGAIGIELTGGEAPSSRVALNRRRPIGEAEAWLLTQLKAAPLVDAVRAAGAGAAAGSDGTHPDTTGTPSPESIAAAREGMQAFLQFAAFATGERNSDSPSARASRMHGLLEDGTPDIDSIARGIEARTGRPIDARAQHGLATMTAILPLLADPAAIARDPTAFATRMEAETGHRMTPGELAELRAWASAQSSPDPATAGPGAHEPGTQSSSDAPAPAGTAPPRVYINAASAVSLSAPFLFGTFLQGYVARHGWTRGLNSIARLRWRVIAGGEIATGFVVYLLARGTGADLAIALGIGIGLAGGATWVVAPAMPARTAEGAMMTAQLAAYRRTLQRTLGGASSIEDAVGSTGLAWLETPDQVLAWGVALGLRPEIEALLARTSYVPAWFDESPAREGGPRRPASASEMFAGIEAIGSRTNSGSAADSAEAP
jgi:hypothetical protein